jgi:glyoxylase-like metal-dependent hydrolase (beta-lactamase superfamily II)
MSHPVEGPAVVTQLAPQVMRLELPVTTLPPFTHTNTYLVQSADVGMLIDPGFSDEDSLKTVQRCLERQGVRLLKAILLTHSHNDHSDGVQLLQRHYPDAPVYVHPLEYPRLELPNLMALNPERTLMLGDTLIQSVFTPGHSPGHLSYYLPALKLAFVGDIVAGHGSTWVGHPEGDIQDYLASIERLRALKLVTLAPGHGAAIHEPYNRLNEARQHRLERLEQVISQLSTPKTLAELREHIYPELPERMVWFAERSLLALLKKLMADRRVVHLGGDEAGPYGLRH